MKKILFVLFIAVLFLGSCKKEKSIKLSDWHILGPFKSNNTNDYLQFDNLKKWGLSEEQIDFSSFKNITPEAGITNSIYENDLNIIEFCKHFGFDPFNDNFSGNAYAACSFNVSDTSEYYINFSSDDGGKVFLNNKEIINLEKADLVAKYEVYKPVKLKKGENFLLVKVNNGLYNWQAFVEIEKFSKEGLKEHYNLMSRLNNDKFFKLSLYDTTNVLIPSQSLPDTKFKVDVYTKEDSLVLSGQVIKKMNPYLNISGLRNGLYYAKLYMGDRELIQDIYKGDLIEAIKSSIHQLGNFNIVDEELKATIDANIFRFNHLLKPDNRGKDLSEKREWQRKMIYLYKTFSQIEKNIDANKGVKGIPHTVLRSFVSRIDNGDQYYISHAPRNYNPEMKYPVVIFAPYFLSINRPYLESMRVADIVIQENLQYFADKYGMIILEPFCREVGRYNLNSIAEADLFEVLNSVKTNYNIDTTRMFLAGSCAGGDKALRFAGKYPHLFAGMGLASPALSANKSNQEWYQENLPFEYILNIENMPVLVMHSVNDRHTSINNSLYLAQLAKENHLKNFTFVKTENDVEEYFWYKYAENIFEFFSKIKPTEKTDKSSLKMKEFKYNTNKTITILERETRDYSRVSLNVRNNKIRIESSNVKNFSIDVSKLSVDVKKPISVYENGNLLYKGTIAENNIFVKNPVSDTKILLKNNLIEGPFTDIFTNRFIIVIGSLGSVKEAEKNERIAQYFNEAWKNMYFNGCMIKYDYQINDADIENANLLLIGDFKTNKILSDIAGKLPLSIMEGKVTIGNHTEVGRNLNLYMVYPNPKNKDKYVGIFSGDISQHVTDMMDIAENEFMNLLRLYGEDDAYFDISGFGWYDYKIWDTTGNTLYSGYFNDHWQN